jgi:hypothetical protein
VSARNGDKARFNKQLKRRRVHRAALSTAHKIAVNRKAMNVEPAPEAESREAPRGK